MLMDHNHLTIKTYMAIMAERDAAIRERNMALEERKRAFSERDMAMLQRDAALAERNVAISERNEAISALRFRENSMSANNMTPPDSPGNGMGGGAKYIRHQQQQIYHATQYPESAESPREFPTTNTLQIAVVPTETAKPRKVKQPKEKRASSTRKSSKSSAKGRKRSEESGNQVNATSSNGWKNEQDLGSDGEDLVMWKDDLGLNQIDFDDSAMPVPVCSCTGVPQPCYKWGNGGWQSACCTTTMSMYPLPQMSNKRHARVGGRKMSGGAFNKLLNRLAMDGHDLSSPLDLKDHWAKHGTNRYSTQK